jgi:hypothetical protein
VAVGRQELVDVMATVRQVPIEWFYFAPLNNLLGKFCRTQPYACVDKEGQSRTQLNVLYADAVPWNSPSDDQLANIILKAIFNVLISTLHTYPGQVCMGPLRMR